MLGIRQVKSIGACKISEISRNFGGGVDALRRSLTLSNDGTEAGGCRAKEDVKWGVSDGYLRNWKIIVSNENQENYQSPMFTDLRTEVRLAKHLVVKRL
jgi:hypothetical protein